MNTPALIGTHDTQYIHQIFVSAVTASSAMAMASAASDKANWSSR